MHGTLVCRSLHWRQPPRDLLCGLRLVDLARSVIGSLEPEKYSSKYVFCVEIGWKPGVAGVVKIRQKMWGTSKVD
jgi:hypothetical protein